MKITVLTLFPEAFTWLKNYSMIQRALEIGALDLELVQIRDFAANKHKKADDYSFGGGPGMVMAPQPLFDALDSLEDPGRVYYLSPQGKTLTQDKLFQLKSEEKIVLLNGHYEGIDQRVIDQKVDEEISIGDYVLSGGEIASLVIIDGISRLLDGVLASSENYMDESHVGKFLENAQYTRPANFRGLEVPEVLLSGHHENIRKFRLYSKIKNTLEKRPDLLDESMMTQEERAIYNEIKKEIEKGGL